MLYGISGAMVPASFPYAHDFNTVGSYHVVGPTLLAAIGERETLCFLDPEAARIIVSQDGGHGIMQLTSSYPDPGWDDPDTNIDYATTHFILPAIAYWHGLERFAGDALIRLVAATYNAGLSNARRGHEEGDVDKYTTKGYAAGVLSYYHSLVSGSPT